MTTTTMITATLKSTVGIKAGARDGAPGKAGTSLRRAASRAGQSHGGTPVQDLGGVSGPQ